MKTKYWVLLFAVTALACLGASAFLLSGEEAAVAEVYAQGELVATLPLAVDQEITVDGRNTVTVRDGKVAVTWADCPDQYCVERGWCSGGADVVCLPNRLVISFAGEQELDGVSG